LQGNCFLAFVSFDCFSVFFGLLVVGESIIDPATIAHLKNEEGFYEVRKMNGWHLSVEKKFLEKIDVLEARLAALTQQFGVD
jgi:hypothetical protein